MVRAGGLVVMLALSLCGCTKKASVAECEAMADRNVEFVRSAPQAKPDGDYDKLRTSLVRACRDNGMTAALARCVASAATSQEAVACHLQKAK